MKFEGKHVKGFGEGSDFVSSEGYKKQFKNKLGYEPFLGTFNVKLEDKEVKRLNQVLSDNKPIVIEGFGDFGAVRCYESSIKDNIAHLVFPEKTGHPENIIEFISPVNLSKEGIEKGDRVKFRIIV